MREKSRKKNEKRFSHFYCHGAFCSVLTCDESDKRSGMKETAAAE